MGLDGFNYTECEGISAFIADGFCNLFWNTSECNYDGGDCFDFVHNASEFPEDGFDYSFCITGRPDWIGDGICDDFGAYITPECNFDGGDCGGGAGCIVDFPLWLGDEFCDNIPPYNTPECNNDGGDCEYPKDGFDYSDCDTSFPIWVGDDFCDEANGLNVEECNYDGGDCEDPLQFYPDCVVPWLPFFGDGICDPDLNTPECGYDKGDCPIPKVTTRTATPTATPTAAPTATPTAAPTDSPTAAPTDSPIAVPTAAPQTPGASDLDEVLAQLSAVLASINSALALTN